MQEKIRAAICRIDIVQDGKSVARGTGTLISGGVVLTAFHVIGDRRASPPAVYPGEIRITFPGCVTQGTLHDPYFDAREDWALLKVAECPDVRPVPLAPRCENKVTWETYGFPDANPRDGLVQTGTVENERGELEGCEVLQLFSQQAAAGNGAPVKGASGGPVLIEDALVGVLRFALMKEGMTVAGTLYGCPVDAVLEKTGDLLPVPDPCYGLPGIPRQPLPADPFRYLSRFLESDAEIFFGRKREIRKLYDLVVDEEGPRVILLYGQSGVGKSSFLDAGLVPRLKWGYSTRYQRRTPLQPMIATLIASLVPENASRTLLDAWRGAERAAGKPVVAIFDQIEEVFTQPNQLNRGELEAFIAEVKTVFGGPAMPPQGKLILSFRKEWFPELQKQLELRQIPYSKMFLETMDRDAICDSVLGLTSTRRLAEKYGLRVEPDLAGIIAVDLLMDRESPVAPTLQILLTKMWAEATAVNQHAPAFTLALYGRLKQQGMMLRDFLNQQLLEVRKTHAALVDSGLALDLLNFHTTDAMTAEQRTREEVVEAYSHRSDVIPALLNRCCEVALLVDASGDNRAASSVTRLTHDTLAPMVVRKCAESTLPGQRAHRLLESRGEDWDETQSAPLEPWELALIERGMQGTRHITSKQDRLVKQARMEHEAQRRKARWQRAGAAVALLAIVGMSVWAQTSRRKAIEERDIANLHHQFEVISDELSTDPFAGLALAVAAAWHSVSHPAVNRVLSELQYALSDAVLESREINRVGGISPITAVDVASQIIVAGREDGKLQLNSVNGAISRHPFDAHGSGDATYAVTDVAVSPDGSWFASAAKDGFIKLWRRDGAFDRDLISLPPGNVEGEIGPRYVIAMAATADGSNVVSGWNDGTLRIVPVYGDAAPLEVRFPHPVGRSPSITAVSTKRSRVKGLLVLVGFSNGEVALWSLTERKLLFPPWQAHKSSVLAVDLNCEQGYLAGEQPGTAVIMVSGSDNGVVKIWNGPNSPMKEALQFHTPIKSVRFNAFGNLLAYATGDGMVTVSDLDGRFYFPPFHGFTAAVSAAMFDAESLHVIAGSRDGSLRILDMQGQAIRFPAPTDGGRVHALAFHPSGRWLAGVTSRHIYIWGVDPTSMTNPLHLQQKLPWEGGHALAMSPDGKTLILGGHGVIRTWDFETQQLGPPVPVHCSTVNALAFDPGGDLLAIAGDNNSHAPDAPDAIDLLHVANGRIDSFASRHRTVRTMLFSADGRYLYSGGDDLHARRWDLRLPEFWKQPRELIDDRKISPFLGGVYAMAFTPAQDTLIVGDATGQITRWRDGIQYYDKFQAHNGPVQAIRVHPRGEAMYSVSDSGTLRENSLRTKELLAVATQRQGAGMFSLAITRDGALMATGAGDGAVQLWHSTWNEAAELACGRLRAHPRFDEPGTGAVHDAMEVANQACRQEFWKSAPALQPFRFDYGK